MRRAKRWLLIFAALLGFMSHSGALRPGFPKPAYTTSTTTTTTTTTTEVPETTVAAEETEPKVAHHVNATTKPSKKLTGIPQIDWVWDPNLPRELNGYNLSTYPFFSTVPPHNEIAFKCDGLHDGFYASIEYKCQVYHHCIYGIRHDFLCANFTAFDQRTFICHFVSEVDCENSAKFWNRNDNLYMATTTTSTTTTTTPAPLTPEPDFRRGPNRRPLRRRRPSDYYYDEDYEDDYYEEDRRANRRRKQRPRNRRPEYDDEYEEKRAYSDEDSRFDNKRSKNRDPIRDEVEEDYEEDRRPKPKARPKSRQGDLSERRNKPIARKSAADRQAVLDERRSLSDEKEKPRNRLDDEPEVVPERRRPTAGGRRRKNGQKRPAPVDDDFDEPIRRDEGEEENESPAEVKPAKDEIVVRPQTSAAAGSPIASIFDRPRVAPKIPRPVPIHERNKFGYQGQKATTSTTTVAPLSDEYYDDSEYEEVSPVKEREEPSSRRETPRRRLQDELGLRRTDDIPPRRSHSQTRRGSENPKRVGKPRKPIPAIDDDYEPIPANDESERKPSLRKRPHAIREKPSEDSDSIEEPVREQRPRSRRPLKKEDPIVEDTREHKPRDHRRRPAEVDKAPLPVPEEDTEEVYDEHVVDDADDEKPSANLESDKPAQRDGRPVVRVVKRPFLPSRGGSPYLPRGLQPVGAALKQTATDSTPVDMGSTISGVRLLEHGAPILRETGPSGPSDIHYTISPRKGPRTTLPPQIEHPKAILDELYENDYDVTLNDALNPTLKPLSSNNNRNSLDVRRRTVSAPRNTRQEFRGATRVAQHFYDDFEY
ncbi:serine/arginine repetitive matrix protein 1 isoform X2 [Eupeodes corollae]|uniref:serine/arginine repetitive matrix protein 1 isoform X2 n=1 Tax=Eupeodes corollae TaxID=290404 RepID=UPI00249211AD|nr:serine/arginine repetitive matrix protein 1 isoform X2 [Eupeodes corollae]